MRSSRASRASWESVLPSWAAISGARSRRVEATRKAICGRVGCRAGQGGSPGGAARLLDDVRGGDSRWVRSDMRVVPSSQLRRHDVDDKQDVLPVVGVVELDGNNLQLAFPFVAADVPPSLTALLGEHARGCGAGHHIPSRTATYRCAVCRSPPSESFRTGLRGRSAVGPTSTTFACRKSADTQGIRPALSQGGPVGGVRGNATSPLRPQR